MSQLVIEPNRAKAGVIVQLTRPFSFTASILPIVIGAAATASFHPNAPAGQGAVAWWLFPFALLGGVLFHAGTNAVSDYYDFKYGIDRKDTQGSSGVLVGGLMTARQALVVGLVILVAACIPAGVIAIYRGWPIVVLGAAALVGGFFYAGWPIGYKYFALGDLMVFVLMGPIMVLGAFFTLTGSLDHAALLRVLLISLPIGCLVTAILHANNIRDIQTDRRAGCRTVANILGHRLAKWEYYSLVCGAFALVVAFVLAGVLKPWTLIVFASLPPAVKNLMVLKSARPETIQTIATLDVRTAQHHLLFGLLYALGLTLSALLGDKSHQ
jgi:1,4-dihydroxy-2-naphthoate octaprenyltransferase